MLGWYFYDALRRPDQNDFQVIYKLYRLQSQLQCEQNIKLTLYDTLNWDLDFAISVIVTFIKNRIVTRVDKPVAISAETKKGKLWLASNHRQLAHIPGSGKANSRCWTHYIIIMIDIFMPQYFYNCFRPYFITSRTYISPKLRVTYHIYGVISVVEKDR